MDYVANYEDLHADYGNGEPKWVWQVRKTPKKAGKLGAKLPYVYFKNEVEALAHIDALQRRADKKAKLAAMTPEEKEIAERIEHAKKLGTPDDPAFECQICSQYHLGYVKRGVLAHHGYQRPGHGYQTQSCYGALKQPLHVSCDALPPYIAAMQNLLDREKDVLARILATPPAAYTVQDSKWNSVARRHLPVDRKVERPEGFEAGQEPLYTMTEYERCYRNDIRHREGQIEGYRREVAHQTKKLQNWMPNPDFKGYYRP
jgi:hypothetical protein